jgi:hypothetical protein
MSVAKDKKKKTKDKKDKKKADKTPTLAKSTKKAVKSVKAISKNPLVADVVAAALIGMAAALKDSDKARRMANDAGDQLSALSKSGVKKGNAMWDMALEIGQKALETLTSDDGGKGKRSKSR